MRSSVVNTFESFEFIRGTRAVCALMFNFIDGTFCESLDDYYRLNISTDATLVTIKRNGMLSVYFHCFTLTILYLFKLFMCICSLRLCDTSYC